MPDVVDPAVAALVKPPLLPHHSGMLLPGTVVRAFLLVILLLLSGQVHAQDAGTPPLPPPAEDCRCGPVTRGGGPR